MPTIRYAASPAGHIAYLPAGAGPPLCDPGWVTHLCGQLGLFSFGAFTERLAAGPPGRHAMQVWCGLADSRAAARAWPGPGPAGPRCQCRHRSQSVRALPP